jgi:SPP1 gp7 family putative phage head morphogenesis protein
MVGKVMCSCNLSVRSITLDAMKKRRSSFAVSNAIEKQYEKELRKVARMSGQLVESHVDGIEIVDEAAMVRALSDYSKVITPWATRKSFDMISQTNARNRRAWEGAANKIGRSLRQEVYSTPTGFVAQQLLNEQVTLIRSIPIQAGERAQKLAMQAALDGSRADVVQRELLNTTEVTESRAMLIARTEVAKSNATINRSRATSIGSEQYVWRTMGDADVRESHAEVDGEVFSWNNPPTLSDGETTHPGEIYNCRCYAEPVLPEE